jgi:hypothetical protein
MKRRDYSLGGKVLLTVVGVFGVMWFLSKADMVPSSWAVGAAVLAMATVVLLAVSTIVPKRSFKIREWHAGHIGGLWGVAVLWVWATMVLLELRFGRGESPEVASLLVGVTALVSLAMVVVTAVWATGHPHAKWHPLKLALLWLLVGIVSSLWYLGRSEDVVLLLSFFLVVPAWISMVVVTWTWLSAREGG